MAPARTVRVRRAGEHAFLTIKGESHGAARAEFEYAIPLADVDELLALCPGPIIEKTRHRIGHGGRIWEVDVFDGDNAGLIVAEVEIPDADATVDVPDWAGEEVTPDPRYHNANLSTHPFSTWGLPTDESPVRAEQRSLRRTGVAASGPAPWVEIPIPDRTDPAVFG